MYTYSEVTDSVFNGYTNLLQVLIYLEKHFHADKQHGIKLAISVLQLIFFPFLFLVFNLIIIHLHLSDVLNFKYLIPFLWMK